MTKPGTERIRSVRNTWHFALQPVAAAGLQFAESQDDDSHSNVFWDAKTRTFSGRDLGGGITLGLRTTDLSLVLLRDSEIVSCESVVGKSLTEVYELAQNFLTAQGYEFETDGLVRPTYDLPAHPLADDGARFPEGDDEAAESLGASYTHGIETLASVRAAFENASEVRGWPHHFDIATLIVLDVDASIEDARSVGVGMSPGDGSYDEPYYYISPWPYPNSDSLGSPKPGFHWHADGFTAAIALMDDARADSQFAQTIQEMVSQIIGSLVR